MSKLRNYQAWKLKKLGNPIFAANYLNEIENSSPELVLAAIQNVVRAREVSAVAKEAGVARENIYRAFTEQGNPTVATFREVLRAVGVKFHFEPIVNAVSSPTRPQSFSGQAISLSAHALEQSASGPLGSSDKEASITHLGVPYLVCSKPSLGGVGQQKKTIRSEHGRYEEAFRQPAIG